MPLSRRADYPRRVEARNRALELNSQHVPEVIRVLFVGESPPAAFMRDGRAYFYASGPERANSIAYHMSQVLFEGRVVRKEEFFRRLEELGYYLVDAVKCPINDLKRREGRGEVRRIVRHCANYLREELKLLNLREAKVVFIGREVFETLRHLLDINLPCYSIPLPFGSRSSVERFRRELAEVLSTSSERRVVEPPGKHGGYGGNLEAASTVCGPYRIYASPGVGSFTSSLARLHRGIRLRRALEAKPVSTRMLHGVFQWNLSPPPTASPWYTRISPYKWASPGS